MAKEGWSLLQQAVECYLENDKPGDFSVRPANGERSSDVQGRLTFQDGRPGRDRKQEIGTPGSQCNRYR